MFNRPYGQGFSSINGIIRIALLTRHQDFRFPILFQGIRSLSNLVICSVRLHFVGQGFLFDHDMTKLSNPYRASRCLMSRNILDSEPDLRKSPLKCQTSTVAAEGVRLCSQFSSTSRSKEGCHGIPCRESRRLKIIDTQLLHIVAPRPSTQPSKGEVP